MQHLDLACDNDYSLRRGATEDHSRRPEYEPRHHQQGGSAEKHRRTESKSPAQEEGLANTNLHAMTNFDLIGASPATDAHNKENDHSMT